MASTDSDDDRWLLYDGACPFCSNYVRMLRIADAEGPLRLVDARQPGPECERALAQGFDLNQGFVLHLDDRFYAGADAMHRLALVSTPSGAFNAFNAWLFRRPGRARCLYPILRAGRNAALALLGRPPIDQGR